MLVYVKTGEFWQRFQPYLVFSAAQLLVLVVLNLTEPPLLVAIVFSGMFALLAVGAWSGFGPDREWARIRYWTAQIFWLMAAEFVITAVLFNYSPPTGRLSEIGIELFGGSLAVVLLMMHLSTKEKDRGRMPESEWVMQCLLFFLAMMLYLANASAVASESPPTSIASALFAAWLILSLIPPFLVVCVSRPRILSPTPQN